MKTNLIVSIAIDIIESIIFLLKRKKGRKNRKRGRIESAQYKPNKKHRNYEND